LIPGPQPIDIRPYQYTLDLKDEIKIQVHDMLTKKFI